MRRSVDIYLQAFTKSATRVAQSRGIEKLADGVTSHSALCEHHPVKSSLVLDSAVSTKLCGTGIKEKDFQL